MVDIIRILENQKEVKYLTYFIYLEKDDGIVMELSSVGVSKKYKFRNNTACLNKIIDILFELKKLETWTIKREDRKK